MPRSKEKSVQELLRELMALQRDSMIVKLLLAGIGQHQIRQIVEVDIHRVSRIAKLIKRPRGARDAAKPEDND
jgi:hypothetical protein